MSEKGHLTEDEQVRFKAIVSKRNRPLVDTETKEAARQLPSGAAKVAFIKAHARVEGGWVYTDQWEEALNAGLTAAYRIDFAAHTELLDEALGISEELEGQIQALPLGSEIEFDDPVISVLSEKIVRLRSLIERARTPEEEG